MAKVCWNFREHFSENKITFFQWVMCEVNHAHRQGGSERCEFENQRMVMECCVVWDSGGAHSSLLTFPRAQETSTPVSKRELWDHEHFWFLSLLVFIETTFPVGVVALLSKQNSGSTLAFCSSFGLFYLMDHLEGQWAFFSFLPHTWIRTFLAWFPKVAWKPIILSTALTPFMRQSLVWVCKVRFSGPKVYI
jgi:hypothetical protein